MTFAILTDDRQFLSDLGDVVRIFYGNVTVTDVPDGAAEVYIHTSVGRDGQWTDTWRHGDTVETLSSTAQGHPLTVKRLRKRAVKLGLYRLIKRETGLTPPWGSLTGIRPTRLLYEGMEEGLSREEAVRRVTEAYDVSPDRARLLGEIAAMQQGKLHPPEDTFDLYIGIPFCTTRCSYCSFASGEIGDGRLVRPYVDALCTEISLSAELTRARGLRVRAAYIGGGTPTAISSGELERILARAQRAFPGAVEWTVEAGRPDTIDREKLEMLRRMHVTRISVNPQTFSDDTLRRISRAHTAQQTVDAYLLAREMGFDDINMDLIAALPGEGVDDFAQSIDRAIALAPDSVTVHTLAVKRSSRLHEDLVVHGDDGRARAFDDAAARMVDLARARLTAAGYRPYYLYRQKYMAGNGENVGYARPGKQCLYNIGNMEETASVLALGAGAITKWLYDREQRAEAQGVDVEAMRFSNLQLRIERAPNVRNVEQYIERVGEMVERKSRLIVC